MDKEKWSRIFRLLGIYGSLTVTGVVWIMALILSVMEKVDPVLGLLVSLGWMIAFFLIFSFEGLRINIKYHKNVSEHFKNLYYSTWNEYQLLIGQYQQLLDAEQHCKGDIPPHVAMLSDIRDRRKVSIRNTLKYFAREVKPTDTAFLIRVDHEDKVWVLRMAGCAIQGIQAQALMDDVKKKVAELADVDGLIKKDLKIIYN